MFGKPMFGSTYFGPRYFGPAVAEDPDPPGGGGERTLDMINEMVTGTPKHDH